MSFTTSASASTSTSTSTSRKCEHSARRDSNRTTYHRYTMDSSNGFRKVPCLARHRLTLTSAPKLNAIAISSPSPFLREIIGHGRQEARQEQKNGRQETTCRVGRPVHLLPLPKAGPEPSAAPMLAVRDRPLLQQDLPARPLETAQGRMHCRGGGQGRRRKAGTVGTRRAGEGQAQGGGRRGRLVVRDLLGSADGSRRGEGLFVVWFTCLHDVCCGFRNLII